MFWTSFFFKEVLSTQPVAKGGLWMMHESDMAKKFGRGMNVRDNDFTHKSLMTITLDQETWLKVIADLAPKALCWLR